MNRQYYGKKVLVANVACIGSPTWLLWKEIFSSSYGQTILLYMVLMLQKEEARFLALRISIAFSCVLWRERHLNLLSVHTGR